MSSSTKGTGAASSSRRGTHIAAAPADHQATLGLPNTELVSSSAPRMSPETPTYPAESTVGSTIPFAPGSDAGQAEVRTLKVGLAMVLLDGCGVILTAPTLIGVAAGLAGGAAGVPLLIPVPAIGAPLVPVCVLLGFPTTQTICPKDHPSGVGTLTPPPQGRAIDLVESVENSAAAAGAPYVGLATHLRTARNCKVVSYP